MKYSCHVILDLLPLYHDGVCSEDSKKIVEQHLAECEECREFYENLLESDAIEEDSFHASEELRKASFLKNIQHKFVRRQILVGLLSVFLLLVTGGFVVTALSHYENVVVYQDNISVYMMDHDLVGRLRGSSQSQVQIKRVTSGEENYLFFCVYHTKWDELMTDDEIFSEFILCPGDKNVQEIDKVYYFTGDDTGLESMSTEQLAQIIDESILLWSK